MRIKRPNLGKDGVWRDIFPRILYTLLQCKRRDIIQGEPSTTLLVFLNINYFLTVEIFLKHLTIILNQWDFQ